MVGENITHDVVMWKFSIILGLGIIFGGLVLIPYHNDEWWLIYTLMCGFDIYNLFSMNDVPKEYLNKPLKDYHVFQAKEILKKYGN